MPFCHNFDHHLHPSKLYICLFICLSVLFFLRDCRCHRKTLALTRMGILLVIHSCPCNHVLHTNNYAISPMICQTVSLINNNVYDIICYLNMI